ncbi:MAG: hypothetical protein HY904_01365 [Deltaproteobacteria bacterium]|nr:hypothetical protein [Deltaproteobacteria bacterium]
MTGPRRSQGSTATPLAVPVADAGPTAGPADWREVPGPRQDAPGFTKQWFCHPRAELFVWRDADGRVGAFQFCFVDDNDAEQMVAWDRAKAGAVQGRVDSGESTPTANRSPILREDTSGPRTPARDRWAAVRDGLPPDLVSAVESALGW